MYKVQDFFQLVDRILIIRVTWRLIGNNIPHYKLWTFPQNIEHSVIRDEIRGVTVISILVFTGESILWRQTGRDNLSRVLSSYKPAIIKLNPSFVIRKQLQCCRDQHIFIIKIFWLYFHHTEPLYDKLYNYTEGLCLSCLMVRNETNPSSIKIQF